MTRTTAMLDRPSAFGMSLSRLGACLIGLALTGSAASAAPGDHIHAGDAVITPRVDIGMEWQSNVILKERDPVGGLSLRLSPGVDIALDRENMDFVLGGTYHLRKYVSKGLKEHDRFSDFDVQLRLNALKNNVVGFRLGDAANLVNVPVEEVYQRQPFQTRFRNALDAGLVVRAGPVLEFAAGGVYELDDYKVPPGSRLGTQSRNLNTRNGYGPTWAAKWTFFPRTALMVEGSYVMYRWFDNWVSSAGTTSVTGAFLAVPDSNHFRIKAGVRGRVTTRLVLSLMVGYGSGRYNEQSSVDEGQASGATGELDPVTNGFDRDVSGVDRLLVEAQAKYEVGTGRNVAVGYQKDFRDSFFTNYVGFHRIYARADMRLGSRVGVDGEFSVNLERYFGEIQREDTLLRAKLGTTYYIQTWASVNLNGSWAERASNDLSVAYDNFSIQLLGKFQY